MKKVAIIGAGISGVTLGRLLPDQYDITVFESSLKPGGLVKCDRIEDNLFHRVGGHVFNSKNQKVLDWFWRFFDRDKEFISARRNAKIYFQGRMIGYPIEDYLYELEPTIVNRVIDDLLRLAQSKRPQTYQNFEEFLTGNFGKTLYDLYFGPYNRKIWHTDLSKVPLGWLEGKLPMPDYSQILLRNIIRQEESQMVHSTFHYARENGSQFIIDRLAQGLDIRCGVKVEKITRNGGHWLVNGDGSYDSVVYSGDVRNLSKLLTGEESTMSLLRNLENLPSNGTSNLFCECDTTDMSWLYLPDPEIAAHRIIYTGGFSPTNNRGIKDQGRMTCVVEFSGTFTRDQMEVTASQLPGNMKALAHNHEPNSYVIQHHDTREQIAKVRDALEQVNFYLLGRFGEWEYYNMDKAIEAAMGIAKRISKMGDGM